MLLSHKHHHKLFPNSTEVSHLHNISAQNTHNTQNKTRILFFRITSLMESASMAIALMHAFPNKSNNSHHRQGSSPQAMAQQHPQHPVGRQSIVSTADSAVALPTQEDQASARDQHTCEKKPLYEDLRDLISRRRRHWLLTRDIELARPLQQQFLAFEAGVMEDMHEIEHEREIKNQARAREMQGATGMAKLSWGLYKIKMKVCGKWMRHRLHGSWKHGRLYAKRKELSEEYVRAQISRRLDVVREVIWYANEEAVEDGDDGAYVRDGILNYIVTGYDSMFPISRDLEVDMGRI